MSASGAFQKSTDALGMSEFGQIADMARTAANFAC